MQYPCSARSRALRTPRSRSAARWKASTAFFLSRSAPACNPALRALLLTEALCRASPDSPEFEALADDAARADPSLPFAAQLGELGARMRGERARVTRWLTRQREQATD